MVEVGANTLGYNLYVYCLNNPIKYDDPTGQIVRQMIGMLIKVIDKALKIVEEVQQIDEVRYDVPLYNQGDQELCWAYSQVMVEDFQAGRTRTQESADSRAREIAISRYGVNNWNRPGWPTNAPDLFGQENNNSPSLYEIGYYLTKRGPMYAYYHNNSSGHLVVVTGVNISKGLIYTNNPWGIAGEQTYEEFLNGFVGLPANENMPFGFLIFAQ